MRSLKRWSHRRWRQPGRRRSGSEKRRVPVISTFATVAVSKNAKSVQLFTFFSDIRLIWDLVTAEVVEGFSVFKSAESGRENIGKLKDLQADSAQKKKDVERQIEVVIFSFG